jgi:hypothetical protein
MSVLLNRAQIGLLAIAVGIGTLGSIAGLIASTNEDSNLEPLYIAGLALSALGAMAIVLASESRRRAIFEISLRRLDLERFTLRLSNEIADSRGLTREANDEPLMAEAKKRLAQSQADLELLRELGAYQEAEALANVQAELREATPWPGEN